MTLAKDEDEDALGELPPLDADERDGQGDGPGEHDPTLEAIEYDELVDPDPLDDATAALGDTGLELDELGESGAGLDDDDQRLLASDDRESDVDVLLSAHEPGGDDLDGPGIGEEALEFEPQAHHDAADQGEEGPREADDELRVEDLPELDADDDGELPDAELYDRGAFLAPAPTPTSELPWADDAWEVELLAPGGFSAVTVAPGGALAEGIGRAFRVPSSASGSAAGPFEGARPGGALVVALTVALDEATGDLLLEAGGLARRLPPLPDEQLPSAALALDDLIALRVDEVGVYRADRRAPAPHDRPELLERTRGLAGFALVPGALGARPAVVTAHVEPRRVVLVVHPAGAPPRVVAVLEPDQATASAPLAGGVALAYDPTDDCVYAATEIGLFVTRRTPRGA